MKFNIAVLTIKQLCDMKKVTIVLLAASISFFYSCEKDPSLKKTYVKYPVTEAAPGKWRQMLDTGNVEIIEPAYFSIGSKGFAINQQTNEVYEYNAATNEVSKKSNFPGLRRLSGATAFSIGNKGYYGLGLGQRSLKEGTQTEWRYVYIVDFWEYDPSNDSWVRKADLPIPANPGQYPPLQASFFGAYGIGIGGKGYVGSGRDINFSIRKYLYEFDPQTNTWAAKATPNDTRYAPEYSDIVVAFTIGNKGYIGDSTRLWEFTPSAGSWKLLNATPSALKVPVISIASKTKGYIYGSINSLNNLHPELKNDFWEFTPDAGKGTWKKLADFGGKPRAASPAFILNDKLYMGFGSDLSISVLTDLWEYTPLP